MKSKHIADVCQKYIRFVLAIFALFYFAKSYAHELSMAEITAFEYDKGKFQYAWVTTGKDRPITEELQIQWPPLCQANEQNVQCPADSGLSGVLEINGLGKAYSAVIFKIRWMDGQKSVYTLSSGKSKIKLFGGASDRRDYFEIFKEYGFLGIEHILSGIDHLFFVISLLILVSFRKRLISTITSFTVAHSITLALSALEIISLRTAPVEATIALSIVLVCYEILKNRDSLTVRMPELVAFLFGLLHGLGFAGALKEIGLPQQNITTALFSFNLGVEAGQLFVLSVAWLIYIAVQKLNHSALPFRRLLTYFIGSISMYWTLSRIAVIFTV